MVKLVSIRMVGCQSWEDGVIPLADGIVNVLRAGNSSGKSVLFKMLKITAQSDYFTAKERKRLIRYGCDCAMILYAFSDGSVGGCCVYPTKVIYLFAEDGKTFERSLEADGRLLERLGLVVSDKFVANIIDMDQPLLLVDSNVYENYELIKLLTESPELTIVKERVKLNLDRLKESYIQASELQGTLERRLDSISYQSVEEMQQRLDEAKKLETSLEILCSVLETAERVSTVPVLDWEEICRVLDGLELVEGLFSEMGKVESVNGKGLEAVELAFQLIEAALSLESAQRIDWQIAGQVLELIGWVSELRRVKLTDSSGLEAIELALQLVEAVLSLEKAEEVDLRIEQLLELLGWSNELRSLIEALAQNSEKKLEAELEWQRLEKELRENNRVLQCPTFGEVVFDGISCTLLGGRG